MIEHVIKKGESLEKIAKKYNLKLSEIVEDNKIKDRKMLGIGNTLKIRKNENENESK